MAFSKHTLDLDAGLERGMLSRQFQQNDPHFWEEILNLQKDLLRELQLDNLTRVPNCDVDLNALCDRQLSALRRTTTLMAIENVISTLVSSVAEGKPPSLSYARRDTWQNIRFKDGLGLMLKENFSQTNISFENFTSVRKFAITLKVLSIMYRLIQTDTYCTKRDLYYQNPSEFSNQDYVDKIVDNISCMLSIPRWHLHVLATSKGLIAGDLQYFDTEGNYVDCLQTVSGVAVPTHPNAIKNLTTRARFVLIVEKDAVFQTLLERSILHTLAPCIVITGKGFPDVNTRLMVRRIWDTFHIPILALVDADPHGLEIISVYKFGSKALSFETPSLAIPVVRWLGVLPTDVQRLGLSKEVLIPLTNADKDKARDLLKRPDLVCYDLWKKQLECLVQSGVKAEIEALALISPAYLTEVYLPNKLRFGGWI